MIISPINVIQNWVVEFDKWIPQIDPLDGITVLRKFHIYLLNDNIKKLEQRADLIGLFFSQSPNFILKKITTAN
jgi:hypothetical protein